MDSKYPYETICEESEDEWLSYKQDEKQNCILLFFVLCDFKSVSLQRCETNKPPAMRVRIEGYTVITKKLQTSYNIGVQANCKAKGEKYGTKGSQFIAHKVAL